MVIYVKHISCPIYHILKTFLQNLWANSPHLQKWPHTKNNKMSHKFNNLIIQPPKQDFLAKLACTMPWKYTFCALDYLPGQVTSPTPNSHYWVWTQPPHLQGVVSLYKQHPWE